MKEQGKKFAGLSFEWSAAERAVIVYEKFADDSREPIVWLYNRLQVDTFCLEMEAAGVFTDAPMGLQMVARNLDKP